jgi:hypothetical protein
MDEVLNMSNKEVDRLRVIRDILDGKLRWCDGAEMLDVSERQIGRLCAQVRTEGNRGIIHGLRGRPSNHQLDPEPLERALCALHDDPRWHDFGPTFAQEKLRSRYRIDMSEGTLRRLMAQVGLWQPRSRAEKHRAWRERRSCVGMLVQLDGSDHDWFEGRCPRCVLLTYVDDATSRILHAEFVKVEDTLTLMRSTRAYLLSHGRPVAFYVDKDSIYKVNRQANVDEELRDIQPITQFTRAMGELDVNVICADSPQAKGRVERGFDTHQDRLVKELRLAGICDMDAGNVFLRSFYIDDHNARCAVKPASPANVHKPLLDEHRLDEILSLRAERTLFNDHTLRFQNRFFQLFEEQPVRLGPKDKVEVEVRLDGTTHLRAKGCYLRFKPIDKRPYRPYLAAQPSRAKQYDDPRTKGVGSKPAKDHPWRRFFLHGAYHVALPRANATAV